MFLAAACSQTSRELTYVGSDGPPLYATVTGEGMCRALSTVENMGQAFAPSIRDFLKRLPSSQ